ncbi:MAG: hypothetical protein FWD55_03290 [Propionibacteriaceae bacterium]|nr:hypothetical protein [Propionibacteriaceae bacterium]
MTIAEIATFPALAAEEKTGYPLSLRTGEPRRPVVLLAAIAACWLSVVVTIIAFGRWWWLASGVDNFHSTAYLLAWTKPDPVSALAVIMVIVIGLIVLLMVAAAGVAAYNAWTGQPWIRTGALICLGVTALSLLLNLWFAAAMIPLAAGAALLWLPEVQGFIAGMQDFHTVEPVVVPTTGIKYGPQPLIGSREDPGELNI